MIGGDVRIHPGSDTQGRSVGPGEKARKFSSTGGKAPGYQLSPGNFKPVKRILAPDCAQNMRCFIVTNRRTASPELFLWVRTWRLSAWSRLVWLMHQRKMDEVRKLSVWYKLSILKHCLPKPKGTFPKTQAWAYNRYSRLHRSRLPKY